MLKYMLFKVLTITKVIIIFLTKLMTGRIIEDVKIDNKDKQKPKKPAVDTEHKIEFPSGYTASFNSIRTFLYFHTGLLYDFFLNRLSTEICSDHLEL